MTEIQIEKKRLVSLDVFRGLTIAAMILVNNLGDWSHVYPALRHAAWHGWYGADIVFPFFLFALGASLFFPLSSAREKGIPGKIFLPRIIRRTGILIALGLFLNLFPAFDFGTVRIPGVLQRIGLCYFFAALLTLYMKPNPRALATAGILALYGALLFLVTPSGFGRGSLEPCCNLPGFVDSALFHGHTYEHAAAPGFDPEGLLTTLPAIASAMIGAWAASRIRPNRDSPAYTLKLTVGGAVMAAAGLALDCVVPINKNLWTPSYCLFMGGLGTIVFALCHYLFDVRGLKVPAVPFQVLGRNAIAVYVLSTLAGKAMAMIPVASGPVTLKAIIFSTAFAPFFAPEAASALYATSFLLFWLGIMYLLYRKKIFISL